MVSANAVELKEGWFDMKLNKLVGAPIRVADKVLSKIGLGGSKKGMAIGDALKEGKLSPPKSALEEGKERIAAGPAVTKMKKGGMVKKGYNKMPDGRMMKDSAHKKMAKKSTASKRADGICVKGKTKGRMC